MNTIKAWGLSIAVLAGTGVPAWSASAEAPESRSWFSRVWGRGEAKPAAAKPTETQPLSADALAEAVENEQRAWQRRMDVCTELRRVAIDKNDDNLLRQVEELETQAINLYNQRTAALGVKKMNAPAATTMLDTQAQSLGRSVSNPRSGPTREVPR